MSDNILFRGKTSELASKASIAFCSVDSPPDRIAAAVASSATQRGSNKTRNFMFAVARRESVGRQSYDTTILQRAQYRT
jgi:hypothetical protein